VSRYFGCAAPRPERRKRGDNEDLCGLEGKKRRKRGFVWDRRFLSAATGDGGGGGGGDGGGGGSGSYGGGGGVDNDESLITSAPHLIVPGQCI
jgi:hypothetical protein